MVFGGLSVVLGIKKDVPTRVAAPVFILEEDRKSLELWSRGRRVAARLVLRAKIVLLFADGKLNKEIADELGIREKTAGFWRRRFVSVGLAGTLKDAFRGGRPAMGRQLPLTV